MATRNPKTKRAIKVERLPHVPDKQGRHKT